MGALRSSRRYVIQRERDRAILSPPEFTGLACAVNPDVKPYILRRSEEPAARRLSLDYERALNPQQLAAVKAVDGPALVIAGAGSGKTRTLIYRLAYLIDAGADPASILLMTFTRKAAQEMVERASALIGPGAERVWGGTFHSIANSLLRRYGAAIGIGHGFTILDRSDAEDLVNLVRGQLGLSDKDKRFPRKGTIAEIFSKCENTLQPIEDVVLDEFAHFSEFLEDLIKLKAAYDAQKEQRQLLDYDDLLVKLSRLLAETEGVGGKAAEQFRYILVDEYQDTNRLQAQVIRRLARGHHNVMVVGDDSQSIYAFRGATFRNIMDFPQLFPGTRIYKLEENYRSTQPVLQLANAIIQRAAEKYEKTLFTRQLDGPLPVLVEAGSENTQSRFVVQKILELREEGVPLNEVAVLFRSGFHSFDLELELSRRNVPFVKRGGIKFIEAAHVKDLLAHLRVVQNPFDVVSWNRVLLLIEGVGPKKARDVIAAVMKTDRPWDVLSAVGGRSGGGLRDLAATLEELSGKPLEQVGDIVGRTYEYYLPLLKLHHDDYPKRMRDLEQLHAMAGRYQELETFLADLALEPPEGATRGLAEGDEQEEALILSTIHSAKGLEWRSVFVIWVADGRFPSIYSATSDDDLEEERRLFYVAVTRAKRHLYLTYPTNVYERSSGFVFSRPSRFLDDLPPHLWETWKLQEEDSPEWRTRSHSSW
ncbi:MAG TPA: ATP-dependent helicase [Nitrospiraceae bacterium]|nr:ATP-dependent helicase [Nitrospiraceae bacterium]